MTAQRQHAVDDRLAGHRRVLRLDDHRVLGERDDAVVVRGPERHGRRGDGVGRQRLAAHRPAAVDEQAQRRARLHPPPHAQPLGIDAGPGRPGLDDRLGAGVDVEVAAVGLVRRRRRCARCRAVAPGHAGRRRAPAGRRAAGPARAGRHRSPASGRRAGPAPRRGRRPWRRRTPPRRARRRRRHLLEVRLPRTAPAADAVERLASSMAAAACGPSFRKGKPPSGPGFSRRPAVAGSGGRRRRRPRPTAR